MFSKRNRGPVPVQVVGTHPITKLEYYSKHGRNWFIALLVFSVIALVLGALIVSGVIAYPTHIEMLPQIVEDSSKVSAGSQHFLDQLGWFVGEQGKDAWVQFVDELQTAIGSLVQTKPIADSQLVPTVVEHSKQATLDLIGQWALVVSTITLVLSIIGISVFSYLYNFDRPVSTKKEQKFYRQLEKAEYKSAIKTQKINNAKANKELKANLKADFKSKK